MTDKTLQTARPIPTSGQEKRLVDDVLAAEAQATLDKTVRGRFMNAGAAILKKLGDLLPGKGNERR